MLPQKLGAQCLVHQTHPGTTYSQRLHKRSCVAEDAVHSVEDGDCLEAVEEPPELIPGGKDRKDTHSEPTKTTSKTSVLIMLHHLRDLIDKP